MPWQIVPNGTLRALTNGTLAGMFRGDAPVPRFFLTGDGHRHPPFEWTNVCTDLRLHFQTLMAANQLCVHVETYQDAVDDNAVPVVLQPLVLQGMVFGWELEIYRYMLPLMEQSMRIATDDPINPADVMQFDRELVRLNGSLWMIGNPPALTGAMAAHEPFVRYYRGVANGQPRVLLTETNYQAFLIAYHNTTMGFRTTVNPYIAQNIQRVINLHPNATHLITCGAAHITVNPLQNFIVLPGPAVGIVDGNHM